MPVPVDPLRQSGYIVPAVSSLRVRLDQTRGYMMDQPVSGDTNPWRFFILALGISWFFWLWIIVSGWNVWSFPAVIPGALGLFGPALAEIALIFRAHDKDQWRDYWQRVFDIRRIGGRWHLAIWLTFPAVNALAAALSVLAGSPGPEFETARSLLAEPWRLLPFAAFVLIFGPLPEELGWRGYGLDALQARYSALASSLILGVVWALWHVPLFFMRGTFQHDRLGFGTPGFWSFVSGPVIVSILFTWIYNNTHRSTLSAILFHFMANFTGELMPLSESGGMYSLLLLAALSVFVVVVWGPETLTRQGKDRTERKGALGRFFGRGVCPYQLSFILDLALRRLILSPEELADRLHLREDSRVLEVGSGSGYFSVEVARRLPRGHLELLDIQPEMLRKAGRKIEAAGLDNVGFTQGDATSLPFDGGEFDVAFLVAVLGEVPDPSACLREIYRVLRPSGLLSVTEQPGDPDFLPLPVVRSLAEQQGFEFIESYGRGRNFTASFRKPVRSGEG